MQEPLDHDAVLERDDLSRLRAQVDVGRNLPALLPLLWGIAAFTIIAAMELGRYGIAVNAICPGARTRMTENLPGIPPAPEGTWDPLGAENIAPVVVWLASPEARGITGRVFEIAGGRLGIAEGWRHGPAETRDGRWDPAEVGPTITRLLEKAAPPDAPVPTT